MCSNVLPQWGKKKKKNIYKNNNLLGFEKQNWIYLAAIHFDIWIEKFSQLTERRVLLISS